MALTQIKFFSASDYQEVLAMQHTLLQQVAQMQLPDQLLLGSHPHTITLGRATKADHIFLAQAAALGLQTPTVYEIERGGDITYHGPGQLVGYPILNLKNRGAIDLHQYLRDLESVLIQALARFDIIATRKADYTGVWVGNKKIASIGIAVKRWVTYHGFALNLTTDLRYFQLLKPCGLEPEVMTSMQQLCKHAIDSEAVLAAIVHAFEQVMGLQFN